MKLQCKTYEVLYRYRDSAADSLFGCVAETGLQPKKWTPSRYPIHSTRTECLRANIFVDRAPIQFSKTSF